MNSSPVSNNYPHCQCQRETIPYRIELPPLLTLGCQHEIYNLIISGNEYVDFSVIEEESYDDINLDNNNDLNEDDEMEGNYDNYDDDTM